MKLRRFTKSGAPRVVKLASAQFKEHRYTNPETGSDAEYKNNRAKRLALDGYRCTRNKCGKPAVDTHHIVPVSRGGNHSLANLESVCEYHHDKSHLHLFKRRESKY